MTLRCPNIIKIKFYPWQTTCLTTYEAGQAICTKCGQTLPKA